MEKYTKDINKFFLVLVCCSLAFSGCKQEDDVQDNNKLEQSKISQFIQNNIENNNSFINQNMMSNTKEELNYFRNIQSIFANKGKYICSIINK